jgi:hypothetical protein
MGGLLLTTAAVVSASSAWAQSDQPHRHPTLSQRKISALFAAPFATSATAPIGGITALGLRADPDVVAALEGPIVLPAAGDHLAAEPVRPTGGGLAIWSSNEVTLGSGAAGVDSVRVTLSSLARPRGGVVSARPDSLSDADAQAFDVRYIHGWPSALAWSAGGYAVDVSPHAALGVSSAGGTAEAGAMVRFGSDLGHSVARKLGLHEVDPSIYADKGRWYLFAAASGQAVGLNMTPGAPGMPKGAWSSESTSALVSDAQAGVGWRKGDMQASFGYVHREIKGQTYEISGGNGPAKISDSMVALSLSIHPN